MPDTALYIIRWKHRITGHAGVGHRLYTKEKAKAYANKLNRVFPLNRHWAVLVKEVVE